MSIRKTLKDQEHLKLREEFSKNPEAFEVQTFVEDAETLRPFGIHIKNKERFPRGYIKLLPQDFIVEEIGKDDTAYTIDKESREAVSGDGATIYATLVKCDISTIDAINDISQMLGCARDQIRYSGIKDRDAITSQRISIRNVDLDKVKNISAPYFFLKDIVSGKGVVDMGSLKGNRFTILIRTEADFARPEVHEVFFEQLKKVRSEGFYNFYYLQRFSMPRLINFEWARLLLENKDREAIRHVLSYQTPRELPYFKHIRKQIGTLIPDWEKIHEVIKDFPVMLQSETTLINYLRKNPRDALGAFRELPEQITLWMYGLASLLFNEKISQFTEIGKEPPHELPLLLSDDPRDVDVYKDSLTAMNMYPPPLQNLRAFPFIKLQKRTALTKERVEIHKAEIVPEGVILNFSLNKGEYATTFLSHLFNLIGGKVPEDISDNAVDIKKAIGEQSIDETLAYFKNVIHSKKENPFV